MNLIFRLAFDNPTTEGGRSRAISFKQFRCSIYVEFCKARFEDRVRQVSGRPKARDHTQELLRRFRGVLIAKPKSRRTFENRDCVDRLMESVNHSIRAKFVGGDLLQREAHLTQYVHPCLARNVYGLSSSSFSLLLDLINRAMHLKLSSIHKGGNGPSPSLQCPKIRFLDQLGRSTVLSTHDKNSNRQCRNGTDCLNPAGPSVLCQACIVANDLSKYSRSDKCSCNKCIEKWFLHKSIQSCLKGILA